MTIIPNGATVTPLERKLAEMNTADISADWYARASKVLRGGDGGEHGLLLYKLIRERSNLNRPLVALDVGTARGFSAMTMARAFIDGGLSGHVYTIDIVDHHESLDWHAAKHEPDEPLAGVEMTRSQIWAEWSQESAGITPIVDKSTKVLSDWNHGPIELAFLDGSHAYDDVKRDMNLLDPLIAEEGAIVVDDYHLGVSIARIPSRLVNAVARRLRRVLETSWPRMGELMARVGADNEYAVVTYRLHGVRKALAEFLEEQPRRWSLEIVTMPSRGGYQGSDYSLAVLTRRQT